MPSSSTKRSPDTPTASANRVMIQRMVTTAPASRSDRSARILELRRMGWPYSRIAAELGVGDGHRLADRDRAPRR